jgi:hypothetical protein
VVVYKHMVKMGRPRKPKKDKKDVRLQVVVDKDFAEKLAIEATIEGLDISPFIRKILYAYMAKK